VIGLRFAVAAFLLQLAPHLALADLTPLNGAAVAPNIASTSLGIELTSPSSA